jgi:hypothetical protein
VKEAHLQTCFSPDGSQAIVMAKKETHIWDTGTGRKIASVPVGWASPQGAVLLGLSPDGRTLVVKMRLHTTIKGPPGITATIGTRQDRIALLDVRTAKVRHVLPVLPHTTAINFSRDTRHLITALGDGTALVWEMTALAGPGSPQR